MWNKVLFCDIWGFESDWKKIRSKITLVPGLRNLGCSNLILVGCTLNKAYVFLYSMHNLEGVLQKGPMNFEDGVILFRRWVLDLVKLPSLVLQRY